MASFKGQATYCVDAKGRTAIPAKMRAALRSKTKNVFTITRGFEQCIFLYPLDTWMGMEEKIRSLSTFNREARAFTRRFMMWAEEVKMDSQGRIGLPRTLTKHAGITEKVLILGALDHIEIWDPKVFEQYLRQEEADYETLAARAMEG